MRAPVAVTILAGIFLALHGCSSASHPTELSAGSLVSGGDRSGNDRTGGDQAGGEPADASQAVRRVTMMDACDPATFNAALGDGTCVSRHGGVKLDDFIAQLTNNQKAGAWHNAPPEMTAKEGVTLLAINNGGEVHTFTRVAAFGGGRVPLLNQLSGNPNVAPECNELEGDDFVPPGGTYQEEVTSAATQLFMCCIHPWMRTTVHVH